jgi:hypothetical protein
MDINPGANASDGDDSAYLLSPEAKADFQALRHWWKTFPKYRPQMRRRSISVPGTTLQVGKPTANIAMRSSGTVEIWTGTAGSEADSNTSGTFFNQCPQTVTKGCWVAMEGDYIIQVINPARIIKVTLTMDLITGGQSGGPPTVAASFDGVPAAGMTALLISGGSGYISAPTVMITGGGGAGATATATINASGAVNAVIMGAFGTGYTSNPSVSFSGGGGMGASASIQVLIIYPSWVQQTTIKTGAKVTAIWNDVLQRYEALDWTC